MQYKIMNLQQGTHKTVLRLKKGILPHRSLETTDLNPPSETTVMKRRHEETSEAVSDGPPKYMLRVTVPKLTVSSQMIYLDASTSSYQVQEDLHNYNEFKLMDTVPQLTPTADLCFTNNDGEVENDVKEDISPSTSEISEGKNMCALAVCRLCLSPRGLAAVAGELRAVYEKITGNVLHTSDGRPELACYICRAQLKKCLKLMLMSAAAERVLNDVLQGNSKISLEALSTTNRLALGLCSLSFSKPQCLETRPPVAMVPTVKSEPESDAEDFVSDAAADAQSGSGDDGGDGDDDGVDDGDDAAAAHSPHAQEADTGDEAPSSEAEREQKHSTAKRKEQKTIKTRGPKECDVCHRMFKIPSELKKHYIIHSGEKPYQCDICQRQFTWKNGLLNHILTHTGEKPYQCDVCAKRFNRKTNLVIHLRSHTGEKPFACEKCPKRFSCKVNLARHVQAHTGEKRYKCDICDRRFYQKVHVASHLKIHFGEKRKNSGYRTKDVFLDHKSTDEKCFQCHLCPSNFSQKHSLSYHLRIHSGEKPYQCSVCQHRCRLKASLQSHMRTHTGEKPFKCELCDRRFAFKRDVSRHILTHTGEKPFACHVCARLFTQKANLLRHLVTHERPRTRRKKPKLT